MNVNSFNATPLVTRSKAAELLGLSPHTLAVWASTNRYSLPFVKIGRRVMYRLSDLNQFIDAGLTGGVAS